MSYQRRREEPGTSRAWWLFAIIALVAGLVLVFVTPYPYDLVGVLAIVLGATMLLVFGMKSVDINILGEAPPHDRYIEDRRLHAIFSFVGSLAFIGLGISVIDQIQGIQGSIGQAAANSPYYYLGWALIITGIVFLVIAVDLIHFHPIWLFAAATYVEIFGWWNVYWLAIDEATCGGCHAPTSGQGVGLFLLPPPFGEVFMPFWLFLASTAIGIIGPVVIAAIAPRDIQKCP